jgi:hypothetical protein
MEEASMSKRTQILVCASIFVLASCTTNGDWEGDKTYIPPPASQVQLIGFGVNDSVDVLASGALPITITRDIVNSGNISFSGYTVTEDVILTTLVAVGGTAAFVVSSPAQQTVFTCMQPGPDVPAGGSATVTFTFPGPDCVQVNPASPPAAPLPALPCGLYQEVLTIDPADDVIETDEGDNVAIHYFHVPSTVQTLTINTVRNAGAGITPGPGPDDVTVMFNTPAPALTHTHTINATPAGSAFIANAPTPVVAPVSGDILTVPGMPLGALPAGVVGPQVVTVTVTPNATFVGPLTDILLDAYVERIVSSLTAITVDGCLVRSASHPVNIIHPAQ